MTSYTRTGCIKINDMNFDFPEWNTMGTAPRDGTIIEICHMTSEVPWSGLFRWQNTRKFDDNTEYQLTEPEWVDPLTEGRGIVGEDHFRWRPFVGDPKTFRSFNQDAVDAQMEKMKKIWVKEELPWWRRIL